MAHAILMHRTGGPDVLMWEKAESVPPAAGHIRLRHAAIGLNFIDVYHRTGLYPLPLPAVIGMEGAGRVIEIGPYVDGINVGDRVAYAGVIGAYAEERTIAADRVVALADTINDVTAAAMMLQGMTVRYLFKETFKVGPGRVLLFHAAAGGVGLIAGQWARHLGATIIGTAGSDEKVALAKAHGYTDVINYRTENFVERVRDLTGGTGCDVVYDSVGRDTFPGSLDCLKPRGLWVSFGNASGPVPPFDMSVLSQKGSLFATRPSLMAYTAARSDLEASARDLFDVVATGAVKINVGRTYTLSAAAEAHRDLEARATTGSSVMLV